jgi:hypothetical protein
MQNQLFPLGGEALYVLNAGIFLKPVAEPTIYYIKLAHSYPMNVAHTSSLNTCYKPYMGPSSHDQGQHSQGGSPSWDSP